MKIQTVSIDSLIEYASNPRKNDHAVDRVAAAIREFGFKVPIVAKSDGTVVDGHLRLKAAKKLQLTTVPVLLADDLTDAQIKAFRISVNRMAELADWDNELLKLEFEELEELGYDLELTGFTLDEIDHLSDEWKSDIGAIDKIDERDGAAKGKFTITFNEYDREQVKEALTNMIDDLGLDDVAIA